MVRILLSGGGTLGSVSPLIAIKESVPEADYLFVGTKNGIERSFVKRFGIRYKYIGTVKFRRYLSFANLIDLVKMPFVFFQALTIVIRYRPHIILTSGSFVSVPVAYAGKLCGCTIFIHQQDAQVGLANRMIMWIARVITTTFEEQVKSFSLQKTHWTGNPIRPLEQKNIAEEDLILVLGGSSGAHGLNAAMGEVLPNFSERYEIVHVLGSRNFFQRLSLGKKYNAVQFLDAEYADVLQRARVVVTRAGMSTLTELAHYKKATLVIPMPDTHQVPNAQFFANHEAVVYVPQMDRRMQIVELEKMLTDSKRRSSLGKALHKLFPDDANVRYAKLLRSYFPADQHAVKTAYFVGIGGIGISAVAEQFIEDGYAVIGSDLRPTQVTKQLESRGARIFYDHRKENVPATLEVLIYSTAVPITNEEIVEAQHRHIAVYSYKDYLGEISKKYTTVAISGTHGKTTTTALTGLMLKEGGLDPTIIVGSFVPQLGNMNYHAGKGGILVVEADEYRSDMLRLHPTIAVVTNIDKDHLDFYKDINDITEHFRSFIHLVPSDGMVILNGDDSRLRKIASAHATTYGLSENVDYQATKLSLGNGVQHFSVLEKKKLLGSFELHVPGEFNVLNALAGIAVARRFQIPLASIQKSVQSFKGTWRRFEYIGNFNEAKVFTDYAHHPTAIHATLTAAKSFYPKHRLVVVFQPHSYDRTDKLFNEFLDAFREADMLRLVDVYDVAGRDTAKKANSKDLIAHLSHPASKYIGSLDELRADLEKEITQHDILVIMGAGDIDAFARSLVTT